MICAPTGAPHAVEVMGHRRGVIAIRDEWIVQDRWWTDQPVERHFFELVIEPGRVITTFCDLRTHEWYAYGEPRRPHETLRGLATREG